MAVRGGEEHPFFALHREINRLFDDFSRGFDLTPFASDRWLDRVGGNWHWPNIELSETDKEIKVAAGLPGLDERDVDIQLSNGVLTISGEKKTESQDNDRLFTERYYGGFERRIPVEDVDQDKVSATFKKGLLTVTLPKLAQAQSAVRQISINRNADETRR